MFWFADQMNAMMNDPNRLVRDTTHSQRRHRLILHFTQRGEPVPKELLQPLPLPPLITFAEYERRVAELEQEESNPDAIQTSIQISIAASMQPASTSTTETSEPVVNALAMPTAVPFVRLVSKEAMLDASALIDTAARYPSHQLTNQVYLQRFSPHDPIDRTKLMNSAHVPTSITQPLIQPQLESSDMPEQIDCGVECQRAREVMREFDVIVGADTAPMTLQSLLFDHREKPQTQEVLELVHRRRQKHLPLE
jgi:hypothetical protein